MKIKRVTMDFETRSDCDLKKSGAYKYSLHPSTRATCFAFKTREESKVTLLDFRTIATPWRALPIVFRDRWERYIKEGYLFSAHNAFFEFCIYQNILVLRLGWPYIPPRRFRCTAAKAAACALPRNLEGAGSALALDIQKDKRGYAVMMATCKPTRQWLNWQKRPNGFEPDKYVEPDDAPDVFRMLYSYCCTDVKTEELLDRKLPDLIPFEQEIWFLNQKINWRGLPVDIPLVTKITKILGSESTKRLGELDRVTMGLVTKAGARKSILEFLALDGIELPDIKAKTVQDFLDGFTLSGDMRRLLEIRQALSKTSTKKYQAFLDRANEDGAVRDILLYHGASTGRDTGTGIQPQNFPRPAITIEKHAPYAAVEDVIKEDLGTLKMIYGENLSILFSSILRNMILPPPGHELFVADFAKIEVAVLWWLADNKPGLKILHSGKDPYKYMAAANIGKKYEEIPDEGDDRQLGKAQVLGCGFGMGWEKFLSTAYDQYRLELTEDQAKAAVNAYRSQNKAVPDLWKAYERAAVSVIAEAKRGNKQKVVIEGKCRFFYDRRFLWVELPSGRRLAYRDPSLGTRATPYGDMSTIEFMAVNSKTKKWSRERTWGGTLTENIVQAVARDLMVTSLLALEKAKYRALLQVHDEVICSRKLGEGDLNEFAKIMVTRPVWADKELPLGASSWKGPRYRK